MKNNRIQQVKIRELVTMAQEVVGRGLLREGVVAEEEEEGEDAVYQGCRCGRSLKNKIREK